MQNGGVLEEPQAAADSIADRFTTVFERHMWEPFVAAGLPADPFRPLTESLSGWTRWRRKW